MDFIPLVANTSLFNYKDINVFDHQVPPQTLLGMLLTCILLIYAPRCLSEG